MPIASAAWQSHKKNAFLSYGITKPVPSRAKESHSPLAMTILFMKLLHFARNDTKKQIVSLKKLLRFTRCDIQKVLPHN
jgi:hypothetical protein